MNVKTKTKKQRLVFNWPLTLMFFAGFGLMIGLYSCQEELTTPDTSTLESAEDYPLLKKSEFILNQEGNAGDGGGKVNCPLIKKSVRNMGGILAFNNLTHFWQCADCLDVDYDQYNDTYDAKYPNATAEELDLIDEKNNFNHWQPYIDFENAKKHKSLRADVENRILAWEEIPFQQSNPDDDPDDSTPVFMESVRALLNGKGEAIIGKSKINESFFADEVDEEKAAFDDCGFARTSRQTFTESDNSNLKHRQIKLKIKVLSGFLNSTLKAKMTHRKCKNGKWKRKRARIRNSMSGPTFDNNCNLATETWIDSNTSYKKRKVRRLRSRLWLGWREALVEESNAGWPAMGCTTFGFYKNSGNAFPLTLSRSNN